MPQETTHETNQEQLIALLCEIDMFLDDIKHEIQCEDYAAAEAYVVNLIEQAGNLQRLLHIIPLRPDAPRCFGDASDSDIYDIINFEVTCNEIAAEIFDIVTAVEAHLSVPDNFHYIAVSYGFSVIFCSKNDELIEKEVTLSNVDQGKTRLRLRDGQDNGHGFMFDQLTNCTLLPLWLDDLLNISSLGLKINFTITKSHDVRKNRITRKR